MQTIHAAHNFTIELGPTFWRLYNGSRPPDQAGALVALFDVTDRAITCSPAFARARQLPGGGGLRPQDIARVVIGWAPESQNWHLGLVLAARPETEYRLRWCGLASWPGGQSTDYMAQAMLAGQVLARAINRPFHVVPAPPTPTSPLLDTQPLQVTTRLQPVDALTRADRSIQPRPAPFEFEHWAMLPVPKGYVWQRRGRWMAVAGLRVVGFSVLGVLFVVLGIGSLTRGLAQVSPGWLPLIGISVGALLEGLALRSLGVFLSASDVIVDTTRREVRCQFRLLAWVRWRVPFERIAYLVVSQAAAQGQGRQQKGGALRTLQHVWLHLYDGGQFRLIAGLEHVTGLCHDWDTVRQAQQTRGRRRLHISHYDTPAHHAALVVAQALGADLWLDIR